MKTVAMRTTYIHSGGNWVEAFKVYPRDAITR